MDHLQHYGYAYDDAALSDTISPYSTYTPLEPHHPVASTSASPVQSSAIRPSRKQLIPRPLDWRPDFIAHIGTLSSRKSVTGSNTYDMMARQLLDILAHRFPHPPISYDLRLPPAHAQCVQLGQPPQLGALTSSDLIRPTTQPPVAYMRLYHYRLPWYIDVVGPSGRAVTVGDVLSQLHTQLNVPLRTEDVENEELRDQDRDDIRAAYWRRCGALQSDKMRRVDFLCEMSVFVGLMRNVEDGTWELVLRSP